MVDVVRRIVAVLAALTAVVAASPAGAATVVLGHSIQGRPIVAVRVGDPAAPAKVLVVGCIHGNERAGMRITRLLAHARAPAGAELWIVPTINPDGAALDQRGNAHGVDLNRNHPFRWKRVSRSSRYYGGPRPLSEPESRVIRALVLRLRPVITIYYHQPFGLVDLQWNGRHTIARRYARLARMRARTLDPLPGTVTSWQADRFRDASPFVVELADGPLSAAATRRHERAVLSVAAGLAAERGGPLVESGSPIGSANG